MFAVDGAGYEIDLKTNNAAALRRALDKYVASSRKLTAMTTARRRRLTRPTDSSYRYRPRAQSGTPLGAGAGLEISKRGRIPAEIIDRYPCRRNG